MSAKPPARKDPGQTTQSGDWGLEGEMARKDPQVKPLFDVSVIRLVNKDPDLHYVLVNLKIERMAAIYKMRGYRPVNQEPGGVESIMGPTVENGQVIEIMGMTLMARPMEMHLWEQGRASEMCKQIEQRIAGKSRQRPTIDDEVGPVVRQGKKILDVVNEGNVSHGFGG